ncbi:hypothetical protein K0B96_08525 [Horticoccus luteus]|uniref:Uncharacterized protein n=1 Tax=Horticoccus luteus TaxID=2862869 RepID=A0A8F9TYS8_9BACT|nr:hypothetical protein [Horticoccus luteus]QYM80630.1 hypothetical protein K0B96_08525 [Horticoccus luteus]
MKKKKNPAPRAAGILGVGLDNDDGHKRITTGEKFVLVGGSAETHGRMTETVVKTFEELKARGKELHQVEPRELADIVHKSTPA